MKSHAYFTKQVVNWYNTHQRALPWRSTKDPYSIWLSEVILQQTRVNQGLPYYYRFLKRFPTVKALANAKEESVLKEWQGLGYYTRARNLHRCAKTISEKHKGKFPSTYSELIKLPGIGPYTAAAIASISFNECVPVVDGNVNRVLCRVFGIEDEVQSSAGKRKINALANELIDCKKPATFNQAVMEFGALHCSPHRPQCDECPLSKICIANKDGIQRLLPVKKKKAKLKLRYLTYFIIWLNGKIAMQRRNGEDIWKGLYEPFLVETKRSKSIKTIILSNSFLNSMQSESMAKPSRTYAHLLSHQKLNIRFVDVVIKKKPHHAKENERNIKFYSAVAAKRLPKPIVIHRFIEDHVLK